MKDFLRQGCWATLVCLLFCIFVRGFVFEQCEIPSASMEPTLLVGDYVLVNRFLYAPTAFAWERELLPVREVRRGDVVVFAYPPEPEQDFIKRVVGLPGETVALRDGQLWVDGRARGPPQSLRRQPRVGPGGARVDQGPGLPRAVLHERAGRPARPAGTNQSVLARAQGLSLLLFHARRERFFTPIP